MSVGLGIALWARISARVDARESRKELKKAQRDWAVETAWVRTMLDHINDGVVALDGSLKTTLVNRRFEQIFGSNAKDRPLTDFVHPDDRDALLAQLEHCLNHGKSVGSVEFRGRRRDTTEFPLECSLQAIDSGGLRIGVQAVMRDVSHQRLIETSQRALAQRLEFFFSEMPLGCILWDSELRIQEWNEAAETIFGWPAAEVLQSRYDEVLALRDGDPVAVGLIDLLAGKLATRHACRHRTRKGDEVDCEWYHTTLMNERGEVTAIASMVADVTQRKVLEQQLVQAQKMEAVGTLAGGVAHDFNNLLTTIIGNVSLTRMRLGPSHPTDGSLRDAETAADRAAELTQQLLNFSRKAPARMETANLLERLEESVELFRHGLSSEITLETDFAEDLWPSDVDVGQIGQILMNLLVNARDAVGDTGCITATARNRTLDAEFCESHGWAEVGDWLEIAVADDGPGVPENVQARIFEPFYTTKPVGKGTGLGLSVVYGIVNTHRGGLELETAPDEGARFVLYLRRSKQARPERSGTGDQDAVGRGSATILLADDQVEVRRLAARILRDQGYRVVEAADGRQALDEMETRGAEIDLVLVDETMPGRTGRQVIEELRGRGVETPIILTSGYAEQITPTSATRFLAKPYTPLRLLRTVSETLTGVAA